MSFTKNNFSLTKNINRTSVKQSLNMQTCVVISWTDIWLYRNDGSDFSSIDRGAGTAVTSGEEVISHI